MHHIGSVLSRQGFAGRRVVLAVPAAKVLSGVLELPPRASGAPLEQLARIELSRIYGYDPDQAEMFCWDLPPSPRAKEASLIYAVACRHEEAEPLLDLLAGGRLHAEALDSPAHALVRACRRVLSGGGITGILDLGWDRTLLCLHFMEEIIYLRVLPEFGIGRLAGQVADRLSLDAEAVDCLLTDVGLGGGPAEPGRSEAPHPDSSPRKSQPAARAFAPADDVIRSFLQDLVGELKAPLSYAGHQYPGVPLETIALTGFGASVPHLAGELGSRLEMRVRTVTPRDVVAAPESMRNLAGDPSLMLAIGLAMFDSARPRVGATA